jgi:hypothetical protein
MRKEEEGAEEVRSSCWWSSLLGKEGEGEVGGGGGGGGGPVLFEDVGRQAKDLVENGFDVKGTRLMLSCLGPTAGSTITSTASITTAYEEKKDMVTVMGVLSASFQRGNTKHDFSFDTTATQVMK